MDLPTSDEQRAAVFAETVEWLSEGLVLIDPQLRILWLNRAAERLSGVLGQQVTGASLAELAPPDLRKRFQSGRPGRRTRLDALLRHDGDIELQRPDGSRRWISLRAQSVGTAGNRMLHLRDMQPLRDMEHRMELLSLGYDAAPVAIIITDAQGRLLQLNRGASRLLGKAQSRLRGQPLAVLVDGEQSPAAVGALLAPMKAGQRLRELVPVVTGTGKRLWCEIHVQAQLSPVSGELHRILALTAGDGARFELILLQQMLSAMAGEASTPTILEMLCHQVEQLLIGVIAAVNTIDEDGCLKSLVSPSLPPRLTALLDGQPMGPMATTCGTAAWRRKRVVCTDLQTDPSWHRYRETTQALGLRACWSTPVVDCHGRLVGTFALYRRQPGPPDRLQLRLIDCCVHICTLALERADVRQRIEQLSAHDPLTGLPNRHQFMNRAQQILGDATFRSSPAAVLVIDIERFRQANDVLGQHTADSLLRAVGQRLQSLINSDAIAGRLSGDQFAVLVPNCNSDAANRLADEISAVIGQPLPLGGSVWRPAVSIGISLYREHARSLEELLRQAEHARHHARHSQQTPERIYRPDMDGHLEAEKNLERKLRAALSHAQINVHYQPQINLHNGLLHGVEALARWQDPVDGDIPPSTFIPLAESCGLIGELGLLVLDQACAALRDWQSQGLDVGSVSINFSPTDFRNPALAASIMSRLQAHDLLPTHITLEITEALAMDRHPDTMRNLRTLSTLGIRMALDDFGTGYASFSHLRELPISELKLDQSFVASLSSDPISQALALAVARIGQATGMAIVAEGVTNPQQAHELAMMGFTAAQGFHYAPAMPASRLALWIDSLPPITVPG